jgi:hypothetical protein
MFDAKALDAIARKTILEEARRRLQVGQKMRDNLEWDDIESAAKDGEWTYCVKARKLSVLFYTALGICDYTMKETKEIVTSQYHTNTWQIHFDRFIELLERDGYEAEIVWERLSESRYEFSGKNDFRTEYESKRNLWIGGKRSGYWGRPTLIMRWGKALSLADASKLVEDMGKDDVDDTLTPDFFSRI